jgi:hypothetical protein
MRVRKYPLACGCWSGGLKWAGNRWRMVFLPSWFWCVNTFRNCECGHGYE